MIFLSAYMYSVWTPIKKMVANYCHFATTILFSYLVCFLYFTQWVLAKHQKWGLSIFLVKGNFFFEKLIGLILQRVSWVSGVMVNRPFIAPFYGYALPFILSPTVVHGIVTGFNGWNILLEIALKNKFFYILKAYIVWNFFWNFQEI